MIINVNVDVPDGENECDDCRFSEGSYCNLFDVLLGVDKRATYKCRPCLNATRVED